MVSNDIIRRWLLEPLRSCSDLLFRVLTTALPLDARVTTTDVRIDFLLYTLRFGVAASHARSTLLSGPDEQWLRLGCSRTARITVMFSSLQSHDGSTPSNLPCRIDDRIVEFRQEAPVVEIPPWVEVAPMVGSDGAPSTA